MSGCSDLCTAAKCEELENRINGIEAILENLRTLVNLHLRADIPQAHGYQPNVEVGLAVNSSDNSLKVFVKVDDQSDDETITLPIPDQIEPKPPLKSNLKLNGSFNNGELNLSVADGESEDSINISIPRGTSGSNSTEPEPINLSIDGSYQNEILYLTIAGGGSFDTAVINIPIPKLVEPEPINLRIDGNFQDEKLYLTIAGGGSFDTAVIPIIMNDELLQEILDYSQTIYKILGGGIWAESGTGTEKAVSLAVDPEIKILELGTQMYEQDSANLTQITATNLLDLINIHSAVNYHRNGFHRLPATTLRSLVNTDEGNEEITIYDTFSWQEYLIHQIDALVGEFPIKIKHQGIDETGNSTEQDIELNNISVAIAEILALNLGIAHDADTNVNISMKTLVEARNAVNAAIVGVDYAQANAQYLGYKGNQIEKEVNCTFTPNATNLRDTLKPSNQKIISWENQDQETLIELIKKTLIGTEIIKAALFHPYQPGGEVTGDGINHNLTENQTKNDTEWEQFKQRINNPSGRYQVPKPQANLRDLTIDQPNP